MQRLSQVRRRSGVVVGLSRIITLVGAIVAAAAMSPLTVGASAAPSFCPGSFGTITSAGPPACWRPYGESSPFNRQLPASPTLASDSGAVIGSLRANGVGLEGGKGAFAFTTGDGRDGVYYPRPSDPVVTIHCTYYWGPGTCTGADGVSIDAKQIHIPAGAQPQDHSVDMHMTIVDQSAGLEYDFEHASWAPDHRTLNVYSGAEEPIGSNRGTGLGGGATAADFATLAGLITAPEMAAGSINHALAVSVPCTTGVVYPAPLANGFPCSQITAYTDHGASLALGALLQLNMSDAQIAASTAPGWEKTIMTAMAHYGLYVNDTNGNGGAQMISLEAESDISYTSLGRQPLLQNFMKRSGGTYYAPLSRWILGGPEIDLSKLRVLSPCVARGTCPGQAQASSVRHGRLRASRATRLPAGRRGAKRAARLAWVRLTSLSIPRRSSARVRHPSTHRTSAGQRRRSVRDRRRRHRHRAHARR